MTELVIGTTTQFCSTQSRSSGHSGATQCARVGGRAAWLARLVLKSENRQPELLSSDSAGIETKLTSPITKLIHTSRPSDAKFIVFPHGTVCHRRGTVAEPSYVLRFGSWNRLEPSWNRRGTVLFVVFFHMPGAFPLR